jgi:hypothetical protein
MRNSTRICLGSAEIEQTERTVVQSRRPPSHRTCVLLLARSGFASWRASYLIESPYGIAASARSPASSGASEPTNASAPGSAALHPGGSAAARAAF